MNERYYYWLRFAIFAVIISAIIIVLNLFVLRLNWGRWDLTKNKIYTVSPTSSKILSGLKVPVNIEYYVSSSDKLPAEWKDLQQQVNDKLKEIASVTNGKMKIEIMNPTLDEEWKKRLQSKGVSPFAVKAYEKDQISSKIIFSSIVISYKDKKDEVISQVIPSTFANLEYEVISRIVKMTSDQKQIVAIYAPLEPVEPWMVQMYMQMGRQPPQPKDNYQTITKVMEEQNYEVVKINFNKEDPLPKDATTFIIMNPKELSDRQVYEVNKFLQKGGNVIICAQLYSYKLRGSPDGGVFIETVENKTGLEKIFTGFGVGLKEKILCDESVLPMSMPISGEQPVPVKLPHQMMITDKFIKKDSPMTQHISNLLYLWGNAVQIDEKKLASTGLKTDILFTTTDKSWFVNFKKSEMKTDDFKPVTKRAGEQAGGVVVTGKFPDLYQGKQAPEWQKSEGRPNRYPRKEGKEPKLDPSKGRLILFGSTKMFEDDLIGNQYSLQYFQNIFLFVNTVDVLTVGEDLINIRGKTFLPVRFQQPSNGEMLFWRIMVLAGIPLIFIIFGIVRSIVRRQFKAGRLSNRSLIQYIMGKSFLKEEEEEEKQRGDINE
ncbi:MAG: GldG family protein [Candidatus Coatesbacteria bacterium]|nr:GldG family protein [Candidatus Coatesbacteria bacterium]